MGQSPETFLVTYDLHHFSRDYPRLYTGLKLCGHTRRLLASVWLIESLLSADQILGVLLRHVHADDRLLVTRLAAPVVGYGLPESTVPTA